MHPTASMYATAKEARAAQAVARHAHEMALTHKHNLRYVHVRDEDYDVKLRDHVLHSKGGVTVAYSKPARKSDRIIRVSCALVHENDSYCKRIGRYNAACNFELGEFIEVRVPKNTAVSQFLKGMFGAML
jgi:hypothetical protein